MVLWNSNDALFALLGSMTFIPDLSGGDYSAISFLQRNHSSFKSAYSESWQRRKQLSNIYKFSFILQNCMKMRNMALQCTKNGLGNAIITIATPNTQFKMQKKHLETFQMPFIHLKRLQHQIQCFNCIPISIVYCTTEPYFLFPYSTHTLHCQIN